MFYDDLRNRDGTSDKIPDSEWILVRAIIEVII